MENNDLVGIGNYLSSFSYYSPQFLLLSATFTHFYFSSFLYFPFSLLALPFFFP